MTSVFESNIHDGLAAIESSKRPESSERHLRARVASEFREMPGLALTLAQASRLFSLETDRCERVLGSLVQHGVLVRRGEVWRVVR